MSEYDNKTLRDDAVDHLVKPQQHIDLLIKNFRKGCQIKTTEGRRNLSTYKNNERQCLLLLQGSVALYRSSDCLILNSETAPYIFGLSQQLTYTRQLYIRTQGTTEYATLPLTDAYKIIQEQSLWESVAKILDYSSAKVYSHCLAVSQLSAYEIIRRLLIELDNEPPEIRLKIAAANYILSRTFLSRSGVMRILARLKAEGHLEMIRGVLIKINGFPEKF
ncbi:helix-turn-helix domain-containing protein [Entomohabitans teleogrylli]|uniref:helix-turn-helix domain-containing protein n=1 Tax=Entomohabitans teleogrylli TaxID=1384589 RepID=UPI00073DB325|nr:helix-turn-helix domain-containing protein [Entomohabitans teleogrylli]